MQLDKLPLAMASLTITNHDVLVYTLQIKQRMQYTPYCHYRVETVDILTMKSIFLILIKHLIFVYSDSSTCTWNIESEHTICRSKTTDLHIFFFYCTFTLLSKK